MAEPSVEKLDSSLNSRSDRGKTSRSVSFVGGSAAGWFAAGLLAHRGVMFRVLEAAETLEPPARTLIVTPHMRSLLGASGERSVLNEIRRFEIFTDGRVANVPLKHPDLIIERRTLIQSLAEEAQRAGATIEMGKRFHSLQPTAKGLVVNGERTADGGSEEICVDTVIGSDGAASRVARSAGWAPLATVPLMQAIVPLPKDMAPDTTRVWFIPQDTPYFYWLIPESKTHGALGVIGATAGETRKHLENFLEKRGLTQLDFQGARIPVYKKWIPVRKQIGNGSVYLVGDA